VGIGALGLKLISYAESGVFPIEQIMV